jgi:hypothetical protein
LCVFEKLSLSGEIEERINRFSYAIFFSKAQPRFWRLWRHLDDPMPSHMSDPTMQASKSHWGYRRK